MHTRRLRAVSICFINVFLGLCISVGADASTRPKHFLWRVSSDSSPVYILGSIHLATSELHPLDQTIEETFRSSDTLVIEIDADEKNRPRAQMAMMRHAAYYESDSIRAHLSAETYGRAKATLRGYGLSINQFHKYKPWFLSTTLTLLELQKLGFDPRYGIDYHFLDKARFGKKIETLEDVHDQIRVFNLLSDPLQEFLLLSTIAEIAIIEQPMR